MDSQWGFPNLRKVPKIIMKMGTWDPHFLKHHNYPVCMRKGKAIGSVRPFVCLSVSTKIAWSGHLGIWSTTDPSKSSKNWLYYASNCLAMPTNIANAVFLLATPIDSAHVLSGHAHNLAQYVGKDRQLHAHVALLLVLIYAERCRCNALECLL
jgi:hypothetical protein